ncbi:hypothetical protein Syun_019909 [Stephania yunnanensis]|uniref:Uncharacterized protein n=1 Tax=Stephania yunnanensis TaxID=152371 RepID=A0AAP0IUV9_9MAGN
MHRSKVHMTHNFLLRLLMGNCLSSSPRKTQNIDHDQVLRVVRVDTGKVHEYKESVLVKDLLMNFYGGSFFVGLTQDADHSMRLAPDHELKIGRIYYLIPRISSSSNRQVVMMTISKAKERSLESKW